MIRVATKTGGWSIASIWRTLDQSQLCFLSHYSVTIMGSKAGTSSFMKL
jgi:hypothetical protein